MATAPMGKRTTLKEVAADAAVSIATASYVLAGRSKVDSRARVSEATAERVRASARRLNYRVNASAHATRTGRTGQVLLAMTVSADPWVQATVAAVSAALDRHDIQALVIPDGNWYRALQRLNPDAVFIDGLSSSEDQDHVDRLVGTGLRIIVLGDQLEPRGYDVIDSRAIEGCRLSMRHLIELGHERIACLVVGPTDTALTTPGSHPADRSGSGRRPTRLQVYRDELAAAGLTVPDGYQVSTNGSPLDTYQAAVDLLRHPEPPTAIYCGSDYLALSVLRAAERLGVAVPTRLSVVGAGNVPDGLVSTPALTTVGAADEFAAIAEAVRLRATGDDSPARRTTLQWSLIERDTTAHPPPHHVERETDLSSPHPSPSEQGTS